MAVVVGVAVAVGVGVGVAVVVGVGVGVVVVVGVGVAVVVGVAVGVVPMSRPPKPHLTGRVTVELPEALGERIRELAKRAQCDPRDWILDVLDTFIKEHRSGKDHVVPDYEERPGSYYDEEGCREPRRL